MLAIAGAIAVLGSRKFHELQQKAHEAERIGQYRLKQVLGFGGMGTVYLAEHVLLRRPCAIKLIRPDQAGDPRTLVRFEREVQAAATLTHWNTIEIFDYGHTEDGTFYYVMEYLPGMNLEDLVEQHGAMPPERAVHFLRQVCQALHEAHGIGLIHRDVKPSNIFACERGKIPDVAKLLDFGLVTTVGTETDGDSVKLTRDGTITGSPAFMSPEQARGRHPLDARTDIYNLGAVAYYLMTGQLPFDRQSTLEMLHAHGYEPLVPSLAFKQARTGRSAKRHSALPRKRPGAPLSGRGDPGKGPGGLRMHGPMDDRTSRGVVAGTRHRDRGAIGWEGSLQRAANRTGGLLIGGAG